MSETEEEKTAAEEKPAAKKAPAAKKPAATKAAAEKKPAAAKSTTTKAAADKPAAAAKPATKSTAAAKPAAKTASKPAAKKASEDVSVMYLHDLRPAPGSNQAKTRVGRGEGSKGKTSGRGTKGTKARYQVPARFEGGQMPLHMRLPKLRGFKNPFHVEYQVVNLDRLSEAFPKGGTLTVDDLVAKGLVRKDALVKVLGTGEAAAKFDLTVDAWSGSAKAKVEAQGGTLSARER